MMPNIFGIEPGAIPLELLFQAFSLKIIGGYLGAISWGISWGDAPRFDVAGLQPVGKSKSLKGSNTTT